MGEPAGVGSGAGEEACGRGEININYHPVRLWMLYDAHETSIGGFVFLRGSRAVLEICEDGNIRRIKGNTLSISRIRLRISRKVQRPI